MNANLVPFLWIDLVKAAPESESPGFGVYILGPTNYDPTSFEARGFLRSLFWGEKSRPIELKNPSVLDPFGPILSPGLLLRAWQSPLQDGYAMKIDPSFAEEIARNQVRYLAAEPLRVFSFTVSVEWESNSASSKRESARKPYQDNPRYLATAERLRKKGVYPEAPEPNFGNDAVGIPVSILLRHNSSSEQGLITLDPGDSGRVCVTIGLPQANSSPSIEPGTTIEHRGKAIARIVEASKPKELTH